MNEFSPPPLPQDSQQKTSGMAIASLVLGIVSMTCFGFVTGIPAIIFGHIACGKIKRSGGFLQGTGLAIAGFVLGYVSLVTTTFIVLGLALPAFTAAMEKGMLMQQLSNARQIQIAVNAMVLEGNTTNDKSLGYPADAGITSASQLKTLLIKDGALSAQDAERFHFENFLFGNVSSSDPATTVFIRSASPDSHGGTIVMDLGGEGKALRKKQACPYTDPPRTPAYLKP